MGMVQNYRRNIFSKTKKKYVFFFVFSDEDIWPLARQQVQEQAPVEQVVSVLLLVQTGHPVPDLARVEPVIPEPAQVEMYIPVESQEELQAPASSSMVRMVKWHAVCNWVSGSLTYSYGVYAVTLPFCILMSVGRFFIG